MLPVRTLAGLFSLILLGVSCSLPESKQATDELTNQTGDRGAEQAESIIKPHPVSLESLMSSGLTGTTSGWAVCWLNRPPTRGILSHILQPNSPFLES